MAGRKRSDIPAPLVVGRNRFEAWRRTRKVGARIPDKLWALAVKLADAHGLSCTASALKLDYNAVKKRVNSRGSDSVSVPPAFIELSPPTLAVSGECVVEFERGSPLRRWNSSVGNVCRREVDTA